MPPTTEAPHAEILAALMIREKQYVMEFIVKSADADIAVEIQDYDKQKVGRNCIGVRLIENIILE